MKLRFVCLPLLIQASLLLAVAQEAQQKSPGATPSKLDPQPSQGSVTKMRQRSLEMQKLFNAFLGTWSLTETIEPTESAPSHGRGSGEVVLRPGPGGNSMIEEIHLTEPTGELSGLGLAWWDEKARGYRTVSCENGNPGGCIAMARVDE